MDHFRTHLWNQEIKLYQKTFVEKFWSTMVNTQHLTDLMNKISYNFRLLIKALKTLAVDVERERMLADTVTNIFNH